MFQHFRDYSIRKKLMSIIILTSGIVMVMVSTVFLLTDTLSFHSRMTEQQKILANIIGKNTEAAVIFSDQKAARETLYGLTANHHVMGAYIIMPNGEVFSSYMRKDIKQEMLKLPAVNTDQRWRINLKALEALAADQNKFWNFGLSVLTVLPYTADGRLISTVVIKSDSEELMSRLRNTFVMLSFVLCGSFLLAYIISSKLQRLISKPVLHLAQTMQIVSNEQNYSIRARRDADDELGNLIDGFNKMLSEIEERDEILQERQSRLQILAHFDPLTGLYNRALYHDRLNQALLQAKRTKQTVAAMFVDLDNFKDINDTYGHRVGDILLKDVGERLRTIVRSSDTVARMGGDEFTLLLQNVGGRDNVLMLAGKILKHLSEPYRLEGNKTYITACIGIALFPDDGITGDELMKNADIAMYHAKKSGKNMHQFYLQEMNVRASRRLTMQNDLRRAIEEKEFILYYQPKVNILEGCITGMEALIRWPHPEKGMIMPDNFIPLAEETGLIAPIGRWVIGAACLQIKKWEAQGVLPLPVSVNVSAHQFKRQDFAETVIEILEETGVNPAFLELELTESAIMDNVDHTIKVLKHLRDMGILISIDDFGTGYSSLSCLRRFPIDYLKIDRSFIVNIPKNADDKAIVMAIISMTHSLGMRIVAEGVETEAQKAFLLEQGCDEMQGYLFSKPVPPDLMEKLMKENGKRKFL
jgi:diguanylate cyclase (GGDEF)-like protein